MNFKYKGISYDVGTNYVKEGLSRDTWKRELVMQDIVVIKEQLHCNAILIYGTDIPRLIECSEIALELGLYVWVQPRLVDARQDELMEYMTKAAISLEALRQKYNKVILAIGCELSIFAYGVLPGKNFMQRSLSLSALWIFSPYFNWRLNNLLKKLVDTVKAHFNGEISYGAGDWEVVDWNRFDIIGLNHYMDNSNQLSYTDKLRYHRKFKRPIVVTEFGCCCFEGADGKGGGGFQIINWHKRPPQLNGSYKRNEQVQADYISKLLKVFEQEKIDGAFVFTYIEPSNLFSADSMYDLDMASFGLVISNSQEEERRLTSAPIKKKKAFDELAKIYETQ